MTADDLKNVVVVGSHGGAYAIRALEKSLPATHRIVLIEKHEFAFYPPAALRAAVFKGSETSVVADLDAFFPKGSRHVVLKNTEVTALAERALTLDKEFEGSNTVTFDYAILAMGATYVKPSRPSGNAKEDVYASFKQTQGDIEKAKSVLVLGGGPVGVEFVGEIKAVYPDKKVTLVNKGSRLLEPFKPSLGQKLQQTIEATGAEVKLGVSIDIPEDVPASELLPESRSFSLSDGSFVEADFVMIATGGSPNTSLLRKSGFEGDLDDGGRLKVDPQTLRAFNPKLSSYFALGDVCNAPGAKTLVAAKFQAPVVASQVAALVKGQGKVSGSPSKYKEPPTILMVSFGPKDGQGLMFGWQVGSWITSTIKSKSLFVNDFKKLYAAA